MEPLAPADLANAVTGFCTFGAGVVTLLLALLVRRQPTRWLWAYLCLVITGVFTVGYHAYGTEPLRVADVGTNLLLAYALQLAVVGDFYSSQFFRRFAWVSGLINAVTVAWLLGEAVSGQLHYAIEWQGFGGFFVGEAVLILDCFVVVTLLYRNRAKVPPQAKPLLHWLTGFFAVGLVLASASGTTVHGLFWSYHALWHVLGGFGFVIFWAFNHVRFEAA